jgi:sugar O-acyltransferase (sialic acid O-acetyltransferase NeuD family)
VTREPILLCGAGGHAKACIDVIEQEGRFEVIGLVGKEDEVGGSILGYPVLGTDSDLAIFIKRSPNALVSIGQIKTPESRKRLFNLLKQSGYNLPKVISPRAYVSDHATVGPGSIVFHGAIVNAGAVVGSNCIINSQALVEHDAIVKEHCHISTGAIINGAAHIGAGTFIGSGSVIRERINIGDQCVIGMGQHVSVDCNDVAQVPRFRESS